MAEIEKGKPRPADDCYRILLIDGRSGHMQEIIDACKKLGQEVVAVTTTEQAMAFLESKDHVDVILAEAFLEHESVFDFLMQLKREPIHEDVPIMLMASEPGEIGQICLPAVQQTATALGAYKLIYMPTFELKRLMREIAAVIPEERRPYKESDPDGAN